MFLYKDKFIFIYLFRIRLNSVKNKKMDTSDIAKAQGHWILAKMGKRVLRPGGKELTKKLINGLNIKEDDHVVEFAPGIGFTAKLCLENKPQKYIGIDADAQVVKNLNAKLKTNSYQFMHANAAETSLSASSVSKVYGEAMLTMHADHRKAEIINEAYRILKKGGLYAIHELGLVHNELDEDFKAQIQKDLAKSIRVNARPLTETEWSNLLINHGFKIKSIVTNPMHLLEYSRIIDDEGFFRSLKIGFNILRNGKARKRILEMQKIFRKYDNHMNAIVIIAEKK